MSGLSERQNKMDKLVISCWTQVDKAVYIYGIVRPYVRGSERDGQADKTMDKTRAKKSVCCLGVQSGFNATTLPPIQTASGLSTVKREGKEVMKNEM